MREISQKMVIPAPSAHKVRKICITKAVFAQNTHKSWSKRHQKS